MDSAKEFSKDFPKETKSLITESEYAGNFLFGEDALKKSGMQPAFARNIHLLGPNYAMVTLRAGRPPRYNRRAGPKTGENRTKSNSEDGLHGDRLNINAGFTRLLLETDEVKGAKFKKKKSERHYLAGHHEKDKEHLKCSIFEEDYQHGLPITVTLLEIIEGINPKEGDPLYEVLGFDGKNLRVKCAEGTTRGKFFSGELLIKLDEGEFFEQVFSREWDEVDPKTIIKPDFMSNVSDVVFEQWKKQEFKLYSSAVPEQDVEKFSLEMQFANKPGNGELLMHALFSQWNEMYYHVLETLDDTPLQRQEILNCIHKKLKSDYKLKNSGTEASAPLSAEAEAEAEMRSFYDKVCLPVVGDWDGLDFALSTEQLGLPNQFLVVHNTFHKKDGPDEQKKLTEKTIELFNHYDNQVKMALNKGLELTPLQQLIVDIKKNGDVTQLVEKFAVSRAGCMNAQEFLTQQLSNYAYRQAFGSAFTDRKLMSGLQEAFDGALEFLNKKELADEPFLKLADLFGEGNNGALDMDNRGKIAYLGKKLKELQKQYHDEGDERNKEDLLALIQRADTLREQLIQNAIGVAIDEWMAHVTVFDFEPEEVDKLLKHLNDHIRLQIDDPTYYGKKIRHPEHDYNVHNLFQHGFENRTPYDLEPDGPFLIFYRGITMWCETEEALINFRLSGNIIEECYFDVNPTVDMRKGWGKIVERQLKAGHPVPEETQRSYETYLRIAALEEKVTSNAGRFDMEDTKVMREILATAKDTSKDGTRIRGHAQRISESLMETYERRERFVHSKQQEIEEISRLLKDEGSQQQATVQIERIKKTDKRLGLGLDFSSCENAKPSLMRKAVSESSMSSLFMRKKSKQSEQDKPQHPPRTSVRKR